MLIRIGLYLAHRVVAATLLFLVVAHPNPVAAAQCVTVKLLDKDGVAIPTDSPVIGIMIGGRPAIEGVVPTHASLQAGASMPCPAEIVAQTRATFDEACTSETQRAKAAVDNKVDRKIIDKGCGDLAAALAEPPPPR